MFSLERHYGPQFPLHPEVTFPSRTGDRPVIAVEIIVVIGEVCRVESLRAFRVARIIWELFGSL